MRLIDADELIRFIDKGKYCKPNVLTFSENDVCEMIENQPTVVGECIGCKWSGFLWNGIGLVWCYEHNRKMPFDSFCSQWKDGNKYD